MKKSFFLIVLAISLFILSCEKEEFLPSSDVESTSLFTDFEKPDIFFDLDQGEEIDLEIGKRAKSLNQDLCREKIYGDSVVIGHKKWKHLKLNKSAMSPDYRYTAIVTPLSGNPDLYIFGYDDNRRDRWRRIRKSATGSTEEGYAVQADLQTNEGKVYFSVYGKTQAQYAIDIYKEKIIAQSNHSSWTGAGVNFNRGGWHIGDFNGDGKDDIFRYREGESGADMFLSTGSAFKRDGSWTEAEVDFNQGGWHIGDFNGDGKDDIFRYIARELRIDMFLSTGFNFKRDDNWNKFLRSSTILFVDFNQGGWHIGDFNGDGKDDIFRYRESISGADVFLSTGNAFKHDGSWTPASVNFNHGGWHIGDFNGDGKDDIFRYVAGESGADMFLSTGAFFDHDGSWTPAGVSFNRGGWHIGDFNGDGKDDIFRYKDGESGADVFLSACNSF